MCSGVGPKLRLHWMLLRDDFLRWQHRAARDERTMKGYIDALDMGYLIAMEDVGGFMQVYRLGMRSPSTGSTCGSGPTTSGTT